MNSAYIPLAGYECTCLPRLDHSHSVSFANSTLMLILGYSIAQSPTQGLMNQASRQALRFRFSLPTSIARLHGTDRYCTPGRSTSDKIASLMTSGSSTERLAGAEMLVPEAASWLTGSAHSETGGRGGNGRRWLTWLMVEWLRFDEECNEV